MLVKLVTSEQLNMQIQVYSMSPQGNQNLAFPYALRTCIILQQLNIKFCTNCFFLFHTASHAGDIIPVVKLSFGKSKLDAFPNSLRFHVFRVI
jgi:hypothetical protein